MGHAWIVGVLDDLRTYAELNGLDELSASIAATALAAEAATRQRPGWAPSLGGAGWRERDGLGPHLEADRGGSVAR